MDSEIIEIQKNVCKIYSAEYISVSDDLIVGVSNNVKGSTLPLNGLRHPLTTGNSGWFIWAGDKLSDEANFFKPIHLSHLKDYRPELLSYLGLAPGWRFLINPSSDYEDIWFDEKLLDI